MVVRIRGSANADLLLLVDDLLQLGDVGRLAGVETLAVDLDRRRSWILCAVACAVGNLKNARLDGASACRRRRPASRSRSALVARPGVFSAGWFSNSVLR
jgi:hypothetical protein